MTEPINKESVDRFAVIFRELQSFTLDAEQENQISPEELDEIEALRQIVMETSVDTPTFLTST